ncbi:CHC2 zinc finger domain-containing protein [Xanthobacter sp. DSM 24535]|uniref:DUF7146 domain-containing protein n=1 Tax=Roseixanthobacter psychrophilus TaxID=3119917 RepID=UPI0037283E8D
MSGERDPDFDAWVDDARAVTVAEVVAQRGIRLGKGAVERVGPCPVCGGTDRFGINTRKNVFFCRGAGQGGDAIALVQYLDGADFLGACETLTGRAPLRGEGTRASPEELAARIEARRAKEAKREAISDKHREHERKALYAMWRGARVAAFSPVQDYLDLRGLALPRGAGLRFLPDAPYFHGREDDGRGRTCPRVIHSGPAMLAPITDADGVFRGLHCTWLDLDQPKGKAVIADPETGEVLAAKKVRGSKQGGRILLVKAPLGAPEWQIAGEGIETVLAVWWALVATGADLRNIEFVSGIDLGNLSGRATETVPHPTATRTDVQGRVSTCKVPGPVPDMDSPAMCVPPEIKRLTLLGDGDSDPFTTLCAMERARARHAARVPEVAVAWPPEGMDFNDMLRPAARTEGEAA